MIWAALIAIRERQTRWLVATVYVWYFFFLSLIQIRFAGQLALFVVPFAGVGFVHLATSPRLRRPVGFIPSVKGKRIPSSVSVSSWETVLVVLVLLLILVPTGAFISSAQMKEMSAEDDTYQTALWMNKYAAEQGKKYPDNYVFSQWAWNRLYNYFVNGQSESYYFSQYYYPKFITSESPDAWAHKLNQLNRSGFVVIREQSSGFSDQSTYARLYENFGSRSDGVPGVKHYRTIHTSGDGSIKVFEIVPGARLTVTGPPNSTVRVRTTVQIGGRNVIYKRVGQTNKYGDYAVTVPYSGQYLLNGKRQQVSEAAVQNEKIVGTYKAHFPLDEGHGTDIYDPVGRTKGEVNGASWKEGIRGTALSFQQGTDFVEATDSSLNVGNSSFSTSFWVKGNLSGSNDGTILHGFNRNTASGYTFYTHKDRTCIRVRDNQGQKVVNCGINTRTFSDWTLITGVFDRKTGELRLYRNGTLVATKDATSIGTISNTRGLTISDPNARFSAPMTVDDVRFYNRTLTQGEIKQLQRVTTT